MFQPPKILDSILKLWEESQAENSRLRQDMTSMRQELEATKQQLEAAFQVCASVQGGFLLLKEIGFTIAEFISRRLV